MLIEVSTPIQPPISPEAAHESSNEQSVNKSKSQNNDKQGVFSKLLESLSVKLKGNSPESTEKLSLSAEKTLIDGEESALTGKKEKKLLALGKNHLIPDENAYNEGFISLQNRDHLAFFDQMDGSDNQELGAETLLETGFFQNQTLPQINISSQAAEGELNADVNLQLGFSGIEDNDIAEQTFAQLDASKAKVTRETTNNLQVAPGDAENLINLLNAGYRITDAEQGISPESRNAGKNQDARTRRNRDRVNLEVRDLRTQSNQSVQDSFKSSLNSNLKTERINAEIRAELRLEHQKLDGPQERSAESAKGSFTEALSRELKSHLSSDIVREASLILKNHGEGIIRLSLKPEALGNVKIQVEMTENKITGRIVVESGEAFRAFERHLPVLEKQFQDSGFSEARLDLAFSGEGGSFGAGTRDANGEFPRFSQNFAASRYDQEADRAGSLGETAALGASSDPDVLDSGRIAINIFV